MRLWGKFLLFCLNEACIEASLLGRVDLCFDHVGVRHGTTWKSDAKSLEPKCCMHNDMSKQKTRLVQPVGHPCMLFGWFSRLRLLFLFFYLQAKHVHRAKCTVGMYSAGC